MQLKGHNHRYAVDQMAVALFGDGYIDYVSELTETTAITRIVHNGLSSSASEPVVGYGDRQSEQYALKTSFYKAARPLLAYQPVWGAVSGVKPVQLALKGVDLVRDYYVSPDRAELCYTAADYAKSIQASLSDQDAVLYVGIPFCPGRCLYCSFVSAAIEKSIGLIEPYLEALHNEITRNATRASAAGTRIRAVYIGGGTPTSLSIRQLLGIIDAIHTRFDLSACTEFCVEAGRPDTITRNMCDALKTAGVTRISVNPQTMNDRVLKRIGRAHTANETLVAYESARAAGFANVNMDLIAGLPGDTVTSFQHSLNRCIELDPENVTIHTLTRKRGSDLDVANELVSDIPSVSDTAEMLDYAYSTLQAAGYSIYYLYKQKYSVGGFENTGWTKPGKECIYNPCMMEELCSVIALGAGGATKILDRNAKRRIERRFNKKYPRDYIADGAS